MPLPASVTTVPVHVKIVSPVDGTPAKGRVLFTAPYTLRDTTDNVIMGPPSVSVTLDANGEGTVSLIATDDPDISPSGWAWNVYIATDVLRDSYLIQIPYATVGTLELADIAPAVTPQSVVTYALDSAAVHKTGNETIGGVKTFSASPTIPAPSAATDAASKGYVDSGDTAVASAAAADATSRANAAQAAAITAAATDATTKANAAQAAAIAAAAGKGPLRGVDGRLYRVVMGVIRNAGSPNYWQPINDSVHEPHNIDSVTTDTQHIVVNYGSLNATKVATFVVISDETLTAGGFLAGASVTTTAATITIARPTVLADYVSYNGTSWVSQNGVFNIDSFTSGVLQLSHPTMVDPMNPFVTNYDVSVTGRGASLVAMVAPDSGAVSNTVVKVAWYDWAGVLQTVASTNMKAFVRRSVSGAQTVNPQTVDTTKYPSSDLWIIGVFEVAS